MLPAAVLLGVVFDADLSGVSVLTVLPFLIALVLAMVLRFVVEWCLALAAFWLTKVTAINSLFFALTTFFGGVFAPLAVLPGWMQTVAAWTPFPWSLAFPVEVLLGRRTGGDIWIGYAAQLGWIALALGGLGPALAAGDPAVLGGRGMRHGLRVLRAFLSLGVLNLLQYRSDFAISLLNAVIGLVTQVLALSVVFTATADLGGWGPYDLLVLVGIHFFISGLIGIVMRPSMEALMEGIRLGTFDFLLIKPADSQLLASTQVVAAAGGHRRPGRDRGDRVRDDPAGGQPRSAGHRAVPGHAAGRAGHRLQLPAAAGHLRVLVRQAGERAGDLPGPVRQRRALAGDHLPAVAAGLPDLRRTGGLRGDRPGAGSDRPARRRLSGLLAVAVAAGFFAGSRVFWLVALRRYTGASA